MRIWDIHPAYLNRQSLLGEHRELHGILSILIHGKKGYSKHPETKRWAGFLWALKIRHEFLVAEMRLRNFNHKSYVKVNSAFKKWPEIYIDSPSAQFNLLKQKYQNKEEGRIPLPKNEQELWSQHKYSILARNPNLYKEIGPLVAKKEIGFEQLALILVENLRIIPDEKNIKNALQHMWGHIAKYSSIDKHLVNKMPLDQLLREIQKCTLKFKEPYLLLSTALSELSVWIENKDLN